MSFLGTQIMIKHIIIPIPYQWYDTNTILYQIPSLQVIQHRRQPFSIGVDHRVLIETALKWNWENATCVYMDLEGIYTTGEVLGVH